VTAATEVDRALTQDLLNRLVKAGAVAIFVDPALELRGEPVVEREDQARVDIPAGCPVDDQPGEVPHVVGHQCPNLIGGYAQQEGASLLMP